MTGNLRLGERTERHDPMLLAARVFDGALHERLSYATTAQRIGHTRVVDDQRVLARTGIGHLRLGTVESNDVTTPVRRLFARDDELRFAIGHDASPQTISTLVVRARRGRRVDEDILDTRCAGAVRAAFHPPRIVSRWKLIFLFAWIFPSTCHEYNESVPNNDTRHRQKESS